jgi:hypothetical protein
MKVYSQLEKAQLENLTSDPVGTGLVPGRIWYRTDQKLYKVYDGAAVQTFVDLNTAQTLSNKILSTPQIDDAAVFEQITTPANPSAGYQKIYPKSDGSFYSLDPSGVERELGGGGGSGKNYFNSAQASASTTVGFASYADAAGSKPVDGTGGSPSGNLTLATSGVSPLSGVSSFTLAKTATNLQGEGKSIDFTIDPSDKGKVLAFSMNYGISSGTYADDDLIVYFYDVTNSSLIEPVPYKIKNHTLVSDRFFCEVQVPYNCSSLRLIIHVASTSALAYTMKFDDVLFGPQAKLYGSAITDWVDVSSLVTASMTTNTTKSIFMRKVGSEYEFRGALSFTGAPNNTALTLTLPVTIATSLLKTDKDSLGLAHFVDAGTNNYAGKVVYNSSNSVSIYSYNTPASFVTAGDIGNTVPFTYGNGDSINFSFTVPVLGAGVSQLLSQDASTRVIANRMSGSGFTSTANVNTKATFTSVVAPDNGTFSSSTFSAPVAGHFDITANLTFNAASWTATQRLIMYARVNGTDYEIARKTITATASQVVEVSGSLNAAYLLAGQTVEIRVLGEVAVTAVDGNFGVAQRQGPAQIAASELISAIYERSTTQSLANNTEVTLVWTGKLKDTHGIMNTSTGQVTIPVSGEYLITTIAEIEANSTGRRQFTLKKNGSQLRHFENQPGVSGTPTNQMLQGSCKVQLLAGDVIEVYIFQNSGGSINAFPNGQFWSGFEIHRVGN